MNKAVFLDRDGTLNELVNDYAPLSSNQFRVITGVKEVIDHFHKLGYLVFVITNQPEIARGKLAAHELDTMTQMLKSSLSIDDIAICPHDDEDNCLCRKPKNGMITHLARIWNVDLHESYMIGDSWRDIEAGNSAGCYTIYIDSHKDLRGAKPNAIVHSLEGALTHMIFSYKFLKSATDVINNIDISVIEQMADQINFIRIRGGRLFFLGVGGGAGHASHAVNDFRKLADIECYTPTDNVSELTARINDDGWHTSYANWLKGSRLNSSDGIFVFSVGGGNFEKHISTNIVKAVKLANEVGATVMGVVGRDGGYTAQHGDAVMVVPTVDSELITPLTESFQALIWHLLVSHPLVAKKQAKWESVEAV